MSTIDTLNLPHISASSVSKFVECARKWATEKGMRTYNRTKFTDAGNLVHTALQHWRDPARDNKDNSYESLKACYIEGATKEGFGETFEVFKRGLELLEKAYALSVSHPTIPLHLATTIAVECEIEQYQPRGWALPLKGFIDHLFIIVPDESKPTEIIVGVEDYKTGKSKSWTELTNEDVQAALYAAWTRDVLVPHLESQGYTVRKIVLIWTYINDGEAVPMYENDLDIDLTKEYIASISHQMVAFVQTYNALKNEAEREQFLAKHETPNQYCGYCPVKNKCGTFQGMLTLESTIDVTTADWNEVLQERRRAQALEKYGKERKKTIDDIIRLHLDQEHLDAIEAGETDLYTTQATNKDHRLPVVAEVFGVEFILRHAAITQKAVDSELARLTLSEPDRATEMRQFLEANMDLSPGPRIVRERATRKEKIKKAKTKKESTNA